MLSSTSRITVHVTDANDHDPVWLVPADINSTVTVFARTPIGTVVARVRAGDNDVGDNARLLYSMHRSDDERQDRSLPFEVDPYTGSIVVSDDLVQFFRLHVDNVTFSAFLLATDHGAPSRQTAELRRLTFVVTRRPPEGFTWPSSSSSASAPGFLSRHGNGRDGGSSVAAFIGDGAFVAAAAATGTGLVLLIITLGGIWCVVRRRRRRPSNGHKSATAANRKNGDEVCKYNCRIETLKAITLKDSQKKMQQQQEERLLRHSSTDGVSCNGSVMSRCGGADGVKSKPDILGCFSDSLAKTTTTTTDSNPATSLSYLPSDHSDVIDSCYITLRPAAGQVAMMTTTDNDLQTEFNTFPSRHNVHCRTVSTTLYQCEVSRKRAQD
jgi:hypothetical protein